MFLIFLTNTYFSVKEHSASFSLFKKKTPIFLFENCGQEVCSPPPRLQKWPQFFFSKIIINRTNYSPLKFSLCTDLACTYIYVCMKYILVYHYCFIECSVFGWEGVNLLEWIHPMPT